MTAHLLFASSSCIQPLKYVDILLESVKHFYIISSPASRGMFLYFVITELLYHNNNILYDMAKNNWQAIPRKKVKAVSLYFIFFSEKIT